MHSLKCTFRKVDGAIKTSCLSVVCALLLLNFSSAAHTAEPSCPCDYNQIPMTLDTWGYAAIGEFNASLVIFTPGSPISFGCSADQKIARLVEFVSGDAEVSVNFDGQSFFCKASSNFPLPRVRIGLPIDTDEASVCYNDVRTYAQEFDRVLRDVGESVTGLENCPPILSPAVDAALTAAGLDPAETPEKVLVALTVADEEGLLDVIAPDTTSNEKVILEPGGALVLGIDSTVNADIKGSASSTVVIGDDGFVNGNIKGVGLSFTGGSDVVVNGLIKINELLVGTGTQARVNKNGTVAVLEVEQGGDASFDGDLRVDERLTLGPYASLDVAGNLRCDSEVIVTIDPTAIVTIGGNNQCPDNVVSLAQSTD